MILIHLGSVCFPIKRDAYASTVNAHVVAREITAYANGIKTRFRYKRDAVM
jgi:hypothetical protein